MIQCKFYLTHTLSCWDQFFPDEQISFLSRLDGESLLIIGAFDLSDFTCADGETIWT